MSDERRLITIEDINNIKYVEDPQISPDGQWIAYVLRSPNATKKSYDTNIYIVSASGGDPIQVTRSGKDSSPCWSPDSSQLAFVSSRADKKPQIYILPMTRPGEPRALTSHDNGAFAPAWSPNGKQIAYLSRMNAAERAEEDSDEESEAPTDELDGKHRKERKAEDEKNRFDPRTIERIPYRTGTSFMDDRHSQIYLIATAEGLEEDEAKPRRLTNADADYDAPQWSKSGRHIVTTRSWNPEADESWQYSNIYLIEVDSGVERRIKDDDFSYYGAVPSYDGDWLLCVRSPRGQTDALTRLTIVPLEGSGDFVDLNLELSRPPADFDWLDDGTIMATILTTGRVEIHKIDPKTKNFTTVVSDEQSIWDADFSKSGDVAFVSRTTNRLDELFFKAADGQAQQMTHANTEFLDDVQVLETHDFWFKNPHGQELQGWYILPPNFEADKKYPLALNIHGGPHVMWTASHRAMWHEWQSHAAAGYVVFFCNPRGSDGYGQEHLAAIHSNWGTVTMEDIMAGVDAIIEKGFVDETRMAITGGSFGGYMTAWIIGNSERFASAVSQRGVYNIASFYGTSDVPILMSSEFDVEPWQDYAKYWQHSPLAYAHNIKTPTLIIHSDNDFRVPIADGEQLFAWIRRATDTPVKLIRYPREGHELSRSGEPEHRMSRLREMINWFNTYIQPEKLQKTESAST
ncbi:MAG: S9 family peptidase [Anaerolineae bacterium]|nr:S9 family peptidase [Anaerolineae bacterium]